MSLLYYSRIRFIQNLSPLLEASSSASVISVYGAGMEKNLVLSDLSLRSPENYSFANCRSHVVYMKTMAFEHLAAAHPSISFTHIYPGLVDTPAANDPALPWWFRLGWTLIGPIAKFFATSPEDTGYRMLYTHTHAFPAKSNVEGTGIKVKATNGEVGGGAYAVGPSSDIVNAPKDAYRELRPKGFKETVLSHTNQAFEDILTKGQFTK